MPISFSFHNIFLKKNVQTVSKQSLCNSKIDFHFSATQSDAQSEPVQQAQPVPSCLENLLDLSIFESPRLRKTKAQEKESSSPIYKPMAMQLSQNDLINFDDDFSGVAEISPVKMSLLDGPSEDSNTKLSQITVILSSSEDSDEHVVVVEIPSGDDAKTSHTGWSSGEMTESEDEFDEKASKAKKKKKSNKKKSITHSGWTSTDNSESEEKLEEKPRKAKKYVPPLKMCVVCQKITKSNFARHVRGHREVPAVKDLLQKHKDPSVVVTILKKQGRLALNEKLKRGEDLPPELTRELVPKASKVTSKRKLCPHCHESYSAQNLSRHTATCVFAAPKDKPVEKPKTGDEEDGSRKAKRLLQVLSKIRDIHRRNFVTKNNFVIRFLKRNQAGLFHHKRDEEGVRRRARLLADLLLPLVENLGQDGDNVEWAEVFKVIFYILRSNG